MPQAKLSDPSGRGKAEGFKVIFPMMQHPYTEAEIQAVVDVMRNAEGQTQGKYLEKFEKDFAAFVGAKYAFGVNNCTNALKLAAIFCHIQPGDEVIVPEPCFVCYAPLTTLAGGVPVSLPLKAENGFRLTADELRQAITPRTKALVLAFPNNPTGAVMEKADLEAVADVLRGTDIAVISDEIYAELTYEGRHTSIAALDGMRERTIVVGGFSKSHAMTGWRLGYLLAPSELTAQMFKIHQYGIMCAPTTSQFAAVDALANGDADVEEMKNEYDCRRRLILDGLAACGIECFPPKGAFYVFPNIGAFGLSSEEFCTRLIDEENVALVPGSAFGESGEGFARVSYAYSVRHIEKALERIGRFVQRLR